jgi:Na+/H+ antiporter NhaD/arsenite permease-like protein
MTMEAWLAAAVFVTAYALIALDVGDRTVVALLGGLILVAAGILDQHEAFAAIDLNVIFLLAGMMVIAGILARTGIFEWLAERSVAAARGRPMVLLVLLATMTAVLSALLDNVTTVVLIVPVTLSVARRMGVSPVPYLISQILASNIGGTATLIGDPPNILIGSAAGLDFDAFLRNLAPVVVVIFVAFLVVVAVLFRGALRSPLPFQGSDEPIEAVVLDRPLLARGLVVVGLTLGGFAFHQSLGLETATIALLGATVLMLIGGVSAHDGLQAVEWRTLFFFIGLFVLVEGIVKVGIVGGVADALASAAGGNASLASVALIWISGIVGAIVDNIPYTATAIPIVERLIADGLPAAPLWWSLALGACLGGNLTLIGASANIVVANQAARAGHQIGFLEFMRYGAIVTILSLLIATGYVWLFHLA